MQRQSTQHLRAAHDALLAAYRFAPGHARAASTASTADRNPADPYRATVFVGANDLLPVAAARAVGGPGDSASPGDLLCAAVAASRDSAIRVAAMLAGIAIESLSVETRGWTDARGPLGLSEDVPAGFQTIVSTVRLQVADGTDRERVQRMLVEAERRCVVSATVRRSTSLYTRIELVGHRDLAVAA